MDNRRQIKNFLLNKPFQGRICFYFVIVTTSLLVFMMLLMNSSANVIRALIFNVPDFPPNIQLEIEAKIMNMLYVSVGIVLFSIVCTVLYGIAISHRFAGPMHAILQYIEQIKTGNYGQMRNLRPGDELEPIMSSLNDLSSTLKNKAK